MAPEQFESRHPDTRAARRVIDCVVPMGYA
jgi:hypothetical protein